MKKQTKLEVREIVAEISEELANQVCRHVGIRAKKADACQFKDLYSSLCILEVRKKLRPNAEDVNLFLLMGREIRELQKRIDLLEKEKK